MARNKRRDLVAGLLNNLSSAAFIGALLQPVLALLRFGQIPTWGDAVAALVLSLFQRGSFGKTACSAVTLATADRALLT